MKSRCHKFKTRQAGFSLAELSAVIAVASILTLTAFQVSSLSMSLNNNMSAMMAFNELKADLQRNFSMTPVCTSMLGGQTVNPADASTPIEIYQYISPTATPSPATIFLHASSPSVYGAAKIDSVRLEPVATVPNVDPTQTSLLANVQLRGTAPGAAGGTSMMLSDSLPIFLVLDSTNKVIACNSGNPSAATPQVMPVCTPGTYLYLTSSRQWACRS